MTLEELLEGRNSNWKIYEEPKPKKPRLLAYIRLGSGRWGGTVGFRSEGITMNPKIFSRAEWLDEPEEKE